jgi:hypothetical protein
MDLRGMLMEAKALLDDGFLTQSEYAARRELILSNIDSHAKLQVVHVC